MRLAVVGFLALSACSARAPVKTVPVPLSPGASVREHVQHFRVKAGVRGYVFVTFLSPGQISDNLAQAWRVDSGVYIIGFNIIWLWQASEYSIRETAAHEVCHIVLGHVDDLADGRTDGRSLNRVDSFWHRQVYRCEVELIGEDLFCQGLVDSGNVADTADCRAYLWQISS